MDSTGKFTPAEIKAYKKYALRIISDRAGWYALVHEIKFSKIKVNNARTRWGSCTSRGHLNFCWRLILMPPQVLDYVIVHELAHLLEMNHSKRFWQKVGGIMPDYMIHKKWLKDNQYKLMV